ncbi:MAG: hypothetical protein Q9218_007018 [Villophora microphyllina]
MALNDQDEAREYHHRVKRNLRKKKARARKAEEKANDPTIAIAEKAKRLSLGKGT